MCTLVGEISSLGPGPILGPEARAQGLGPGLGYLKPKPGQAGLKPGLPGRAGPEHHYPCTTTFEKFEKPDIERA